MDEPFTVQHGNRGLGFAELREMNAPWREVLDQGRARLWRRGSVVDYADSLLFLEKGRVRLTHTSLDGVEKILWYLSDGCVFGETPFFDRMDKDLPSVHVCVCDCRIYTFPRECVERLCEARPELMRNLLHSMARKLRLMGQQASSLYVDDVLARTCKFLAQRIVPGSVPLMAVPNMSHQEMASFLGAHRITLYKILKQQKKKGVFGAISSKGVVILRPEVFFRWAGS